MVLFRPRAAAHRVPAGAPHEARPRQQQQRQQQQSSMHAAQWQKGAAMLTLAINLGLPAVVALRHPSAQNAPGASAAVAGTRQRRAAASHTQTIRSVAQERLVAVVLLPPTLRAQLQRRCRGTMCCMGGGSQLFTAERCGSAHDADALTGDSP
ncbi:hypothetical protein JKP88DRAFT_45449 [Tribonema minus]|uniref:Uncharacterized protein n=1 Tax=Tribonema minus TaxID=303371 RepID=A0A836CII4_9STRA|nr:hypothetical protein JKP88DRAFT_45449 [Tribonema minus]